ncbi:MAG TPA: TetR family transcriptional regulator [Xanthomonadaceae bacterium]|nr:TetR family transcriptional regulator [Xanthomonadaceae bacterium]
MPSRRSPTAETPRGRPRQFDPEVALVAAMRVFWKNGYAGASISTLLNAMGINRASMYAAFGNKEALFRQVLDRYEREKSAYMLDALQQPTARGVAEQLLRGTLALQAEGDNPRGSMSIVHSVSSAPGDESVRQYVLERGAYWRKRLIERIERAQAEGDFGSEFDARSLALSLKATTDGLLIAAGTGTSDAELEGIVQTFLALWPGR